MTDVIEVSDDELSVITEESELAELEVGFVEGEDDVLSSLEVLDEMAWDETEEDSGEGELQVSLLETPAPTPAQLVSDARLVEMTTQNREFRDRIRHLEEELEVKEVEFRSRLLEESNRTRRASRDRQNVAQLEHQISKLEVALGFESEKSGEAREEVEQLRSQLGERREGQTQAEESVVALSQELESARGAQKRLAEQVESLKARVFELHGELKDGAAKRREAQEEISSTIRALEGMAGHSNSIE